jgi:hypothetical protein
MPEAQPGRALVVIGTWISARAMEAETARTVVMIVTACAGFGLGRDACLIAEAQAGEGDEKKKGRAHCANGHSRRHDLRASEV